MSTKVTCQIAIVTLNILVHISPAMILLYKHGNNVLFHICYHAKIFQHSSTTLTRLVTLSEINSLKYVRQTADML